MSGNGFEMEVVFPNTHVGVCSLVRALSAHLEKDAKRYMKAYKCGKEDPAVQDKLQWALALERLADKQSKANRKRWNSEQVQEEGDPKKP